MYQGLNEEQTKALKAITGPVCVFAGAGSGKTRTLTMRIRYMIEDCLISPFNILAITYTNKATNEMRSRLGDRAYGVTILTFHALCGYILRREIDKLGYSKDFTICDEDDQLKIIQEIVKEANQEKSLARDLQREIKKCKSYMIRPENQTYIDLFDLYNARLRDLNMLDFDDLLLKTHELFSEHLDVLNKYQEKYQYILVDEFQDTNLVQYKIVRMLAKKYRNVFIVGDDDQSIYSFRGTNYENFNLFKEDFSDYQLFTLTTNYRSSQNILDYCNRLIDHNINRQKKDMKTTFEGTCDDVVVHTSNTEEDEAYFVVSKIQELSNGNDYQRFAVLYRNSVLSRNIESELIRRNLSYKVYGGLSYLKRREVKDIVSYFRLMLNPNDIVSFKRIINVPQRGIGLASIDKFEKLKKAQKTNVLDTIDLTKHILPQSKYQSLIEFKELILKYQKRLLEDDLVDMFTDFIEEIKYIEFLQEEYDKEDANDRINNVNDFASILYKIENHDPDRPRLEKLVELFDEITLAENKRNSREDDNGITLSTIHSVKGLEFDVVFIIGLEDKIFPNENRLMSSFELEEERRICYVAMTRAKNKLFLCHSITRLLYGTKFSNKPSKFLIEAVGEAKKQKAVETKPISQPTERTITVEEGYEISDKVIHEQFGEGMIISISGKVATIFFSDIKETKKILLTYKGLRKKE